MKPSEKSPEMEEVLKDIFGIDRRESIINNKCAFCGESVSVFEFRDEISRREFSIFGLCQLCQDETFGK